MKNLKYVYFLSIAVMVVIFSCTKEKDIPHVPHIAFLSYTNYENDSADCVIYFKDGDGDIGIPSDDQTSTNDFKMKYLYKDIDGVFQPYDINDTTPEMDTLFYDYRVPDISPEGQYKVLEGTIKANLRALPLYRPEHSIIKFEIRLKDRAGNLSNIVSTNEFSTVP